MGNKELLVLKELRRNVLKELIIETTEIIKSIIFYKKQSLLWRKFMTNEFEVSEKLLGTVLNVLVSEIKIVKTTIFYKSDNLFFKTKGEISVYEFAHKCKEWANSLEDKYGDYCFILTSNSFTNPTYGKYSGKSPIYGKPICYVGLKIIPSGWGCRGDYSFDFFTQAETEQQAIFDATSKIIRKIENKFK